MAEFEAELGEGEEDEGKEESANKDANEESWLKSDRDYTYEEVSTKNKKEKKIN